MLGYIACFALAVGPVTWVILSEIFPTRIRGRAMAIATFCLWVANLIVSQTFPMMDRNPVLIARFNHGFPFWVYAAFCVVLVWVVARFVPETKGRSRKSNAAGRSRRRDRRIAPRQRGVRVALSDTVIRYRLAGSLASVMRRRSRSAFTFRSKRMTFAAPMAAPS